jgi:hypothetical protein
VAAFASVRLPYDALPAIRRNPESVLGSPLPPATFKHLDDQTVAGLAAVFRACADHGLDATAFRAWGVLAAPHFLGQTTTVTALQRFQAEGAWGVSPHVIPHHSLHSVSGTVSQVLKIHGPNLGVGGGRAGTGEALLAAAAWLGRRRVPGVWVVVTTLDTHGRIDDEGRPEPGTACVGLALALLPARAGSAGLRLRLMPGDDAARTDRPLDLYRLLAALEQCRVARGAGGLTVAAASPRVELEWGRPGGRPLPLPGLLLKTAEVLPAGARISTGAEAER